MTTLKYTKRDSQTIQTVAYYKVWDNHLLNIGRYKIWRRRPVKTILLEIRWTLVFPKLAGEINRTKNVKNNSKKYLRVELIIPAEDNGKLERVDRRAGKVHTTQIETVLKALSRFPKKSLTTNQCLLKNRTFPLLLLIYAGKIFKVPFCWKLRAWIIKVLMTCSWEMNFLILCLCVENSKLSLEGFELLFLLLKITWNGTDCEIYLAY